MPDKKRKYQSGQLLDEDLAENIAKKAGWWGDKVRKDLPPDHQYLDVADMSGVMENEKGQYVVNLMEDESYFPSKGRTNPRDTIRAQGGTFRDDTTYHKEDLSDLNPFRGSTSQGSKYNPRNQEVKQVKEVNKYNPRNQEGETEDEAAKVGSKTDKANQAIWKKLKGN